MALTQKQRKSVEAYVSAVKTRLRLAVEYAQIWREGLKQANIELRYWRKRAKAARRLRGKK